MQNTFVIKENDDGTLIYLHDVQAKILEILQDFDRICKENDIEYALAFGTVLGAVRHEGFIPWDDDIDVMMDYKNYDKLVEVLKAEISYPFYFHCNETDNLYNATICEMKYRMGGTSIIEKNFLLKNRCEGDGLFIDVFIIDSISESIIKHRMARIYSVILASFLVITDLIGFKMVWFKKYYRSIGRRYAARNAASPYVGVQPTWIYDGFKDDRLKRDTVFPFKDIDFEGHQFPGPQNAIHYCEKVYGSTYMQFPPVQFQKPKHINDIKL